MINFRNLSNSKENDKKHQENLEKQRKALATPLQHISPRENEKIIKIDKFIFTTFANIESLDYELSLGILQNQKVVAFFGKTILTRRFSDFASYPRLRCIFVLRLSLMI